MELYQLRQFAAVAKYENMTRAAESLNVAQPAALINEPGSLLPLHSPHFPRRPHQDP